MSLSLSLVSDWGIIIAEWSALALKKGCLFLFGSGILLIRLIKCGLSTSVRTSEVGGKKSQFFLSSLPE